MSKKSKSAAKGNKKPAAAAKNNNVKASPKANKTVTIATEEKRSKFEFAVVNILCLLLFLAFGYIAIMSVFQTSVFDAAKLSSENVIFEWDNLALNIFFTALFVVILFKLRKYYDFFAKVNIKYMEIGLAVWTVVLGFIWIFSVTSVPAADSANIFETATQAAQNNYSSMYNNSSFYNHDFYSNHSYYNFFPYQLSFVLFCEIIYRIFGTDSSIPLQVINVLCLGSAYFALARLTKLLFKRKSIEFIAIIMLAVCFQPILFCTYAYGNIIGLSTGIWACLLLIKYFQTGKYVWLAPCGALLVLSTIVKYNNLIYLAAFVIVLVVHTVKSRKWQSIAFALALCVACLGSSQLIIMSYESRANTKFEKGASQALFLDMGLQESYMAPGWYTRTMVDTYIQNNFDTDAANEAAKLDIQKRLDEFLSKPDYAFDFFSKKILSQWNEPSFESIWISQVKSHETDLNGLGKSIYEGSTGQLLHLHFNFYMQIIYILFAVGIYMMFIKRKSNIETILLPLIILGGFGYHLLFEAKSQYALTYIPLFIPLAAFSLNTILLADYSKVKGLAVRINKKLKKA